jgi:DNA-binding NarL/FixJ family response regulator
VALPNIKLVFLTMNEDPELAVEAVKMGASSYLLKKSAVSELLQSMQAALRGKCYITPQIARGMQESFIWNPHGTSSPRVLTPHEREVIQLLARGKSTKQTAEILKITPRTVAFHKHRTMQALGLKTNAGLVQFAIRDRMVLA